MLRLGKSTEVNRRVCVRIHLLSHGKDICIPENVTRHDGWSPTKPLHTLTKTPLSLTPRNGRKLPVPVQTIYETSRKTLSGRIVCRQATGCVVSLQGDQ